MSRLLLEARGLVRVHGRGASAVHALDGVDVDVFEGRTLAVVGESGSGKSTLARVLLGLERARAGRVLYRPGSDADPRATALDLLTAPARRLRAVRPELAIVMQDARASLDPRQRVGDALREVLAAARHGARAEHDAHARGARHERGEDEARAASLLSEVGLAPAFLERYPHQLSGGEGQRVALARALAGAPRLVVLDEPTSALDVTLQARVLALLEELRARRGLALVVVSHDLSLVRAIADDVLVLQRGRAVERGPAARVLEAPEHEHTRALLAAAPDWEALLARARASCPG